MNPQLWNKLFYLKDHYPHLKITMFTIPLRCSEQWLAMIQEKYDWIEMHYHGSNHRDRKEWFNKTEVEFPYERYFYRGFKSPWWMMDQITANVLNKKGFLISAMKGYYDVNADRIYHFNLGQEKMRSVWYENSEFHTFHSHVQEQKNKDGLPDIFEAAMSAFPRKSKFLFISEVVS